MESIIGKAIDWCFSDEILKAIASEILLKKEKSTEKVDCLQVIALKSIMRLEMENDVNHKVLFDLISREPIDMYQFMDRLHPHIHQEISPISQELKSDPDVFFAFLDQNWSNNTANYANIVIRKTELQIVLEQYFSLKIPHPDGKEYDFHWADKCAKMAFAKGISKITLEIHGEGILEDQYMRNSITDMISRLRPVIPPEGWKEAIEQGTRTIWMQFDGTLVNFTDYTVYFIAQNAYIERYDRDYWMCSSN